MCSFLGVNLLLQVVAAGSIAVAAQNLNMKLVSRQYEVTIISYSPPTTNYQLPTTCWPETQTTSDTYCTSTVILTQYFVLCVR